MERIHFLDIISLVLPQEKSVKIGSENVDACVSDANTSILSFDYSPRLSKLKIKPVTENYNFNDIK